MVASPSLTPSRIILSIVAVLLSSGTLQAALAQTVAPALAGSRFLEPGDLDPAVLLPPPPEAGSETAVDELAELHVIQARRTPARLAQARQDDEVEDVTAIAVPLGNGFDLNRLPATAILFTDLRAEDSVAAKRAKAHFQRTRPWAVDPTLQPCDKGDAVKTSYPSGHATMGYAAGAVLARMIPSRAPEILARASDYAQSRLVCGVHYRSDVEASHVLATALVDVLMTKPGFRREFDVARKELEAARLAP